MHWSSCPDLKSSGYCLTLSTAFMVGACAFISIPAQAQNIQTTRNSSVGAQIQYNNTWGQSFEVTGPSLGGGDAGTGIITPFASTTPGPGQIKITPLIVPNSGSASFNATVESLSARGGQLNADGRIDGSTTSSNIVLNQSTAVGVPSITINVAPSESESTVGANILGTNIGVESLQVTGTYSKSVINDLTAF